MVEEAQTNRMKPRQIRKPIRLIFLLLLFAALPGCRVNVVQDDYALEQIDGEISCEYRIGEDAKWMEECVSSDVTFDKDHFLALFQEYAAYDPLTGSKDPMQCDLKILIEDQPEAWQEIRESEFNVRAVFDGGQRNVSLYRYDGKLYFYVLSMGERSEPEEEGEYFVELPAEMSEYWAEIVEAVEGE